MSGERQTETKGHHYDTALSTLKPRKKSLVHHETDVRLRNM